MNRWLRLMSLWSRPVPAVGQTPCDVVFAENKWRLLRYRARPGATRPAASALPVLLVPSLINRHYVLDLMEGKSFVEYLVGEGHDVFLVDWGTPEDEDRYLTFDDICDGYIGRAIRKTARAAGRDQVHLLGYCLGGTLTAIHAAVHPEQVATLTALAAPIAFADEGILSKWTRTAAFDVDAMVNGFGNVPWPLMQASFHLLRPTTGLAKAVSVADRAWDDEFLDGFFAIEKWGNDNVSFPGECYRRYIQELYRGDALIAGSFALGGKPARLEAIRCPTLAVTFEHDHIVPWRSAAVLLDRVSAVDKEHLHLAGGHVGAVVSKKARAGLWPKLSSFWRTRESALASATPP